MIRETPAIRERVKMLYDKSPGGILPPGVVVEDAKSPDSPFHSYFEWDLQKAAYQDWIRTAREIIACCRVEIHTSTRDVVLATHAYVHPAGQEPGYQAVTRIRDDREQALEILKDEFQRVADALRRAKEIAIAFNLESEIDRLMKMVGAREVIIIKRAQLSRVRQRPSTGRSRSRRAQK